MKLFTTIFIVTFLIIFSCSNVTQKEEKEKKEEKIQVIEGAPLYADSTKFKMQILEHGDVEAYENLTSLYDYEWKPMLPYAFIMAELHQCNLYYCDIYDPLLDIVKKEKDMDPDKKEGLVRLALYYLKLNLQSNEDLISQFASSDLIKLYEKGELVEKNMDLVEYLKGGGKDIDKFREEQKAKESKK